MAAKVKTLVTAGSALRLCITLAILLIGTVLNGCGAPSAYGPTAQIAQGSVIALVDQKPVTPAELATFANGNAVSVIREARTAVALRTLAKMHPECDVAATPQDIAQFLAWWRAELMALDERAATKLPAHTYARYQFAAMSKTVRDDNERAAHVARYLMTAWKANACVYRAYGGGRVHNPWFSAASHRDKNVLFSFTSMYGMSVPNQRITADPLDAYAKHFKRAEAQKILAFPDDFARSQFFSYYENSKLSGVSPSEEKDAVLRKYWAR